MRLTCDPNSRQPIYRQLVVNPNTIARAYTELERDGLLITQQGRGVFVAERKTELTKRARLKQLKQELDQLLVEAVHLGVTADELLHLIRERINQFAFANSTAREASNG